MADGDAVAGPLQKLTEKGVVVDFVPAGHDSPIDLAAPELAAKDVGLVAVTGRDSGGLVADRADH